MKEKADLSVGRLDSKTDVPQPNHSVFPNKIKIDYAQLFSSMRFHIFLHVVFIILNKIKI